VKLLIAGCVVLMVACGSTSGGGDSCPALPADRAATPSGCLGFSVAPNARNYQVGVSAITFKVSATNVSAQSCAGPSNLLCGGPALNVVAADGRKVWTRTPPMVACPMLVRLLQPGESMSTLIQWQPGSLPLGAYSVEGAGGADLGRSYFLVC
jgi:hypothetical protein